MQRNLFNQQRLKLTARAPAKLIISGEHSVLYAQPALAMAINRYTSTTTSWCEAPHIHFKFLDLAYAKTFTSAKLRTLAQKLQRNYNEFLQGKCNIGKVLKRPFELLQYSVANLLDYLNIVLPHGVEIAVDSNIPIGCGLGSSAAALVSTLYAMTNLLEYEWQPDQYLAFSKQIESLQHGKSSGLDLHLTTYGGCVMFKDGIAQSRNSLDMPMYIVNTGKPDSTTGECVAQVATQFNDQGFKSEFGNTTMHIDQALAAADLAEFKNGIRHNHRLLQQLGIVPAKVSNFISSIESMGGAAKVCGAGSVAGDSAGAVLIIADPDVAKEIAMQYGYELQRIEVDPYGARIV